MPFRADCKSCSTQIQGSPTPPHKVSFKQLPQRGCRGKLGELTHTQRCLHCFADAVLLLG